MKRILDAYHRLLTSLLMACVAILLVPVSLQMLSRFTDWIPPYIWTEELSRFLLIWMIMIGAMIGVREGTHFDVDVWPKLSARSNVLLRMVSQLFVLLFALVFVIWGVEFVRFGWNQTSELADLPMVYIFLAWPITGLTWVVFLGESFVANLKLLLYKDIA
jgi:TRAP-type C4-dicarboxylate transport system permease small subunit